MSTPWSQTQRCQQHRGLNLKGINTAESNSEVSTTGSQTMSGEQHGLISSLVFNTFESTCCGVILDDKAFNIYTLSA
jgi:hypothetical protein